MRVSTWCSFYWWWFRDVFYRRHKVTSFSLQEGLYVPTTWASLFLESILDVGSEDFGVSPGSTHYYCLLFISLNTKLTFVSLNLIFLICKITVTVVILILQELLFRENGVTDISTLPGAWHKVGTQLILVTVNVSTCVRVWACTYMRRTLRWCSITEEIPGPGIQEFLIKITTICL